MPVSRDHLVEIAKRGGATTARRYDYTHFEHIGSKGGYATKAKYGREHFVAAGKKSAAARRARKETNATIPGPRLRSDLLDELPSVAIVN